MRVTKIITRVIDIELMIAGSWRMIKGISDMSMILAVYVVALSVVTPYAKNSKKERHKKLQKSYSND